jgi:sugar phosphate isomerase/epimerase
MTRREFLRSSGLAAAMLAASRRPGLAAESGRAAAGQRYKIGVCDWMILKRQKLGAFERAAEIGADGVEVDMGSLGQRETFESKLDDPAQRQQFVDTAGELNLEICSIAMSGFYAQSFAKRPTVPRMVQDTLDTMSAMGVRVAFLPLGVTCDLVQHPELRPVIVERLKMAGEKAEAVGAVIGVETALDAAGEVGLLDEVGSPAIQIYFNFANALQNGRDLHEELRTLGKHRICQIHATNKDGVWLQDDPQIDLPKVRRTLDSLGWSGWLVIEGATVPGQTMETCYTQNQKYLRSVFPT